MRLGTGGVDQLQGLLEFEIIKNVPTTSEKKPTPEQLLQQLETEEEHQATSRLKIFLGYASGVGKSFRMLDEGRRRHERGKDVVVAAMGFLGEPRVNAVILNLKLDEALGKR